VRTWCEMDAPVNPEPIKVNRSRFCNCCHETDARKLKVTSDRFIVAVCPRCDLPPTVIIPRVHER